MFDDDIVRKIFARDEDFKISLVTS